MNNLNIEETQYYKYLPNQKILQDETRVSSSEKVKMMFNWARAAETNQLVNVG